MKTTIGFIMTMILFSTLNVFGETVSIPIKKGWTAFGVSVEIKNTSILDYIQAEQVEVIKTLENNTWKYFRNKETDDFKEFVPGRGYFIKANKSFTITFEGYEVGFPELIEGENFVSLPVNKIATAQEFIEKFALYDGTIRRIATYDGPWGPGWGAVDGSRFDAFSEIETHRGYIVVVDKVWTYDIDPPELQHEYFWPQGESDWINIMFRTAKDNATDTQNLKYSVFISTVDYSCLSNLDKREISENETCYVQKVISEQTPIGIWEEQIRGDTLQYSHLNNEYIVTDIIGLLPNTKYFITIVVIDDNNNKTQYTITSVTTNGLE